MKLYYSPTSPFVRKVVITALAAGLDGQITRVATNPWLNPADLVHDNPLSKVPCLVTEDGLALFDSKVICEYLDSIGSGTIMPLAGPTRWKALRQQAIGDGLMDAAILRRMDLTRPVEDARAAVMARQAGLMVNALDALERETLTQHMDIGTLTIACALGFLDFRFASEPWREGRPGLTHWYATFSTRPELIATAPV